LKYSKPEFFPKSFPIFESHWWDAGRGDGITGKSRRR
jgi:hypothetical protein